MAMVDWFWPEDLEFYTCDPPVCSPCNVTVLIQPIIIP